MNKEQLKIYICDIIDTNDIEDFSISADIQESSIREKPWKEYKRTGKQFIHLTINKPVE